MPIVIERQPPERGTPGSVAAPGGGACCCCCCCLHSAGGVIGAITARSKPVAEPVPVAATTEGRKLEAKHSAAGLYWAMALIVSGLVLAYFSAIDHSNLDFAGAMLVLAIVFPGVQLGASLLAAIVIAMSNRVGKDVRLRHLGRITLRAFIGGVIGLLVMLPLLKMC